MLSTPERALSRASLAHDDVFLLKADIDLPDDVLRGLRAPQSAGAPPAAPVVVAAVASYAGLALRTIEPAPLSGTLHWVYRGQLDDQRDVAIRVNRLKHDAVRAGLTLDARLGEILPAHGVAVPRTLGSGVDTGDGGLEFAIFEHVDGVSAESLDAEELAAQECLLLTGRELCRVHRLRFRGAGPLDADSDGMLHGRVPDWRSYVRLRLDDHVAECVTHGSIDESERTRILRCFDDLSDIPAVADRLLHGDAGPANVLRTGTDRIHLLDWEDALVGDPLFDLASTASFHPQRRWNALFDGYGVSAAAVLHERRFWLYMLRIALARTVMRHRFGILDLPGRAPASHRIRNALAALQPGQPA